MREIGVRKRRAGKAYFEWDLRRNELTCPCETAESPKRVELLGFRGVLANARDLRALVGPPAARSERGLLAACYERWGVAAPRRMFGQLAWILWDRRHRRLVAAADRVAYPRVFYRQIGRRLRVAFSAADLLDARWDAQNLDREAVALFLGGAPLPPRSTFHRSVCALDPGHALISEAGGWTVTPFWQLEKGRELALGSDADYAEELWSLLREVVAGYLPKGNWGVALSGGLDSPTLALALRSLGAGARSYAFRLTAPEVGDGELSGEVAGRLSLESRCVDWGSKWPLSGSKGLQTYEDSPYVVTFSEALDELLEKVASEGLDVLYTGWGGDSLFGGSVSSYPHLLLTGRWKELARHLKEESRVHSRSFAGVFQAAVLRPIASPFLAWTRRFRLATPSWLRAAYRRDFRDSIGDGYLGTTTLPGRSKRLWLLRHPGEVHSMAPQVRAASAHRIEMRAPLCDHRLKEFAASLPPTQTHLGPEKKVIVRNLLRRELPASLVSRLGKFTAGELAMRGLRERETHKVWELLTDMRSAELGIIDERRVRTEYEGILAGRSEDYGIWFALCFEAWLRQHF